MAADSAVSTTYRGVSYRVQNEEDHEKVISYLGHLIFCSGNLKRCRALRQYIRKLESVDYEAISTFAQSLWADDRNDDSTGILICSPDNSLVGMLSAQDFRVTELPWNRSGMDIDTLGFRMQEAYRIVRATAAATDHWQDILIKTYSAVACEEIGGTLHILARATDGTVKSMEHSIPERPMRSGVFVDL